MLMQNPAFERMLKYAFIGSKETVKAKTAKFLKETGVDEVIAVSHFYDHNDRLKSYQIFSQAMHELNDSSRHEINQRNVTSNHE
jgi:alkanesulfonate monooxygenase SsuD/methylene tetrahydromethanopterin reductase-like flavin-dependent oxidoreductase (luciferase family)